MGYRMKYGWRQTECRRCHAVRIAGVVCPTCGLVPDAHEVDPERQRRQRIAQAALQTLGQSEPMPDEMADWTTDEAFPEGFIGRLGEWLGTFFQALGSDPRDPATVERLRESLRRLLQYRAVVTTATKLRPWLPLWRTTEYVIDSLMRTARHYLEASGAETPLVAQRAAQAGQQAIDDVAEVVNHLGEQISRWERVSEANQVQDILPALAAEAYQLAGVEDVISLEEAGAGTYQALTGDPSCPTGIGFLLQLFRIQAETILDQDRFMELTRSVYQELTRRAPRLDRLLQESALARDIQDGHERGYAAALAAQAVFTQARQTRQEVRAMLGLAQDLLEGPGKRYIAALLAVIRNDDYDRLRRQDAGDLIHQARQRGLGSVFEGFDAALRNARSHEDFLYEEGMVILTNHGEILPSSERLSVPRLVDRMLAGQETLLALIAAFTAAASHLEVEIIGADFFERLGLSGEEVAEMMLRLLNWTDVLVQIDGEVVRVEGTAELPELPLTAVAMMLSFLPATASYLDISVRGTQGFRSLVGPLEPWRRWQTSENLDKELAYVEAMKAWTIDDRPIWTVEQLRKYLAIRAIQKFNAGYPACVEPLREIRSCASRLGDADVTAALGRLLALARDIELGQVDEKARSIIVNTFSEWATQDVPDPTYT
jgi:hypothetical protein